MADSVDPSEHSDRPSRLLGLAREVARPYAEHPKVAAVAVAGSVGRGLDDEDSDVELDVYWASPPTDEDRLAPPRALGGSSITVWPYAEDEEEWSERYVVDGVTVMVSGFHVSTVDRWLADVHERQDTTFLKQHRLFAILHSVPFAGEDMIGSWQQAASPYPDALARAMVGEHLDPERFYRWDARRTLLRRGDYAALAALFVQMTKLAFGVLCGLNRRYLPDPGLKWLDATLGEMEVLPKRLPERLRAVFCGPQTEAVDEIERILDETLELATRAFPDLDLTPAREALDASRGGAAGG